jgi:WD40 repeat protein
MAGDDKLKAFEAAWYAGRTPLLDDFLPQDETERTALLPELVHLDLEFRLKHGENIRLEKYLSTFPELAANQVQMLELLATEFELRRRLDQDVAPDEYLTRFPAYAACLPEHFRRALTERSRDGSRSTLHMGASDVRRVGWPNIPGCEVLRELGRGGMGIVYLARQPALDRLVAVKVLRSVTREDQQECNRFVREIQAAARLGHPHIVQLHEVGEVDGQPYCLLEYMEGGSLADRLHGALPSGGDAAAFVEPIARAMHYAHEQGIVHRDLKPANILLSGDWRGVKRESGVSETSLVARKASPAMPAALADSHSPLPTPKIADFGLAKRLEEDISHTRSGVILGTASYMAPEQAAGMPSATGPAADIYSLGAILYELLTGRPPFQGSTTLSILEQVKNNDPVAPSRLQPRVARDLETICLKCLEKEPRRRYGSALALAEDLQRFQEGRPILARPTPWWEKAAKWGRRQPLAASILAALVLTVLLGVAGISWQWWRAEERAVEAVAARTEKEKQRQEVIRRFYFNQIARAQQAWLSNRPLEAERLLQECRNTTPELCSWEWDYLARQCRPAGPDYVGHDREVRGLVVTPDSKRLITGSGYWLGEPPGGQIIVWDAASGKSLRQIGEVSQGVQDLALSPDGRSLAAACASGEIKIWDLENLQAPPNALLHKLGNVPHALSFSPDGRRLSSACMDGSTQVWDLAARTLVRRLAIHRGNASGVAYSPDGKWLAATGRDGIVHLLDAITFAEERHFEVYANATALAFSPDSRRLAAGSYAGQVFVWDLAAKKESAWVYAADASYIRSVRFSPDGQHLAICFYSNPPRLVNFATSKTVAEFRGHERGVMQVGFSSDGRRVFTAGADSKVREWDLAGQREPYEFHGHAGFLYEIAPSPDGRYVILPGGRNPTLRITADQQTLIRRCLDGSEAPLVCKGHKNWLTCVAYRPDGLQMASGAEDRSVILWNAESGKPERTLADHQGAVTSIAYGLGGKVLVSGSDDQGVRIWDVETGQLRHRGALHKGAVTAVASSSDMPFAASTGADHAVRIWDLQSGHCLYCYEHREPVAATGAAFSHDGKVLACAFANWTIQLFDIDHLGQLRERGQPTRMAVRFSEDEGRANPTPARPQRVGLTFSRDDRRVVSTAPKCAVQMWDVNTGQEALVFPHNSSLFLSAAFSPDGSRLLASFADAVCIWDAQSRREDGAQPPAAPAQTSREWHNEQAESALRAENWFALIFHEQRLIDIPQGSTRNWSWLATAHLANGDASNHHQACAGMLERYASNDDPEVAGQTAFVCVVDPRAGGSPQRLLELAARAAGAFPNALRVHAAALYRACDYPRALAQFEAAAPGFRRRAWDWLFLAMIQHRLGDEKTARRHYEQALEHMRGANPYFDWKEKYEVQSLRQEAELLLHLAGKK